IRRAFPASCRLLTASCSLPVTVFLTIQRSIFRLRAHIKKVLTAPGIAIGRVVAGAKLPLGIAGHWIDGNATQIDFLLCGELATTQNGGRIVWIGTRPLQS